MDRLWLWPFNFKLKAKRLAGSQFNHSGDELPHFHGSVLTLILAVAELEWYHPRSSQPRFPTLRQFVVGAVEFQAKPTLIKSIFRKNKPIFGIVLSTTKRHRSSIVFVQVC